MGDRPTTVFCIKEKNLNNVIGCCYPEKGNVCYGKSECAGNFTITKIDNKMSFTMSGGKASGSSDDYFATSCKTSECQYNNDCFYYDGGVF